MLAPLVALVHLAVLWLLAGPMFRIQEPKAPPVVILGLTDAALGRVEAAQPDRPAIASARERKDEKPPAVDTKPPASRDQKLPSPATIPSPIGDPARPDLTAEPDELDPAAARSLLERAAAANLQSGGALEARCGTAEHLQKALQEDQAVEAGLALVPVQARSVADAILLWDGAWVDDVVLGGPAAIGPVRAAITTQVRALPRECRDLDLQGPRFLVFAGGKGPTVVALGSGTWRWSELLR